MATLRDLLNTPHLGLTLVQQGAGNPELTWVSTTELLDLSEYLEGGEIVLTTGLALSETDPRWLDFVANLSRAQVAAIGFAVAVSHPRIPAPLVAAASAYRVALFEVPPPTPFIAISKAVAELLRADELRAAQHVLHTHEVLLEGARGQHDLAEILASIANATHRQLAVHSGSGELLARTAGYAPGVTGLPATEIPDTELPQAAADAVQLDDTGSTLSLAPGAPLSAEARSVVAAGAMVLGIALSGSRSYDTQQRELWSRLTEAVITESLPPATLALIDPQLSVPERIRVLSVHGSAEQVAEWRRLPRSGTDRLVTGGEPSPALPGLVYAWQLCPAATEHVEHAISVAQQFDLDVFVGREAPADRAAASRRTAELLRGQTSGTDLLYATPRVPKVRWAERSMPLLEALLTSGAQPGTPDAASLVAEVLGPLAQPPQHAADLDVLRHTLFTLLRHNGLRAPAAAELGVHRNTLRDRIDRVAAVTQRSIDNPTDRAELWLALSMWQLGAGAARTD